MTQIEEEVALTLAAKKTALGEHAIRRGILKGAIEARKLGRDWYLPVNEVERLAKAFPLQELPHA